VCLVSEYPILDITNLWKSYNGTPALQGLDLSVKQGEIFGLLGPNGAGKTTTLKIIVGLLRMDKGIVKVNGVDISEEPFEYKRNIGYMPEAPVLPDYLTAEEFLAYVSRLKGLDPAAVREKVDFYFDFLDLEDKRRNLIYSLSRGMKQKLSLGAALINDPPLLLLDEPFIGLDPATQHKIKENLAQASKNGRSVLVSTHMLDTAERLCDRVGIIHRGRNTVSGDLAKLRHLTDTSSSSTLEEVFLKLTEEAEAVRTAGAEPVEEPRRRGIFRLFGRKGQ